MAGPCFVVIIPDGKKEPSAVIPFLDSYGVKTQIDALEGQARALDRKLIITCSFEPYPPEPEPDEEGEADG